MQIERGRNDARLLRSAAVASLNLTLRFLLELAGVVALAAWGWSVPSDTALRVVLAVLAPAALIVIWATVVAPKAQNPIPPDVRVLIGSGLLLVAAAALARTGRAELSAVFAVLVVANTLLLFVLGRPEA